VLSLIHRLKEQGVAVMLISHRMRTFSQSAIASSSCGAGEKRADKPVHDTTLRK